MAKVKRSVLMAGMSGMLGRQLVFRQMRDGRTLVSVTPDFSNRIFSPGQLTHQSRFQEAAAYARDAAKTNPIYAELSKGTTKNAYNIAVSDWFKPPVIHGIQRLDGHICVDARDNVLVAKVCVTILDEDGKVLEQGSARLMSGTLWEYMTSTAGQVIVEAWDLAGNVARQRL